MQTWLIIEHILTLAVLLGHTQELLSHTHKHPFVFLAGGTLLVTDGARATVDVTERIKTGLRLSQTVTFFRSQLDRISSFVLVVLKMYKCVTQAFEP